MIYGQHHMRYFKYARYKRWAAAFIYVSALPMCAVPGAYSFDSPDQHAEIVKQALYDVLCPGNLALLQKSAAYSEGSPTSEPRKHCLESQSG